MAYNKAKEEYKWKVWKEQEEKKLPPAFSAYPAASSVPAS